MISVRHLKKEYENATPLKDVCVDINKGDVISVIGPSGTGKSTFLRCLNLLETPTSGEITVDGEVITAKGYPKHLLRRKMGMVFQNFNLFTNMNIIENVTAAPVTLLGVPKKEAYEKGMALLRSVGLADKANSYPDELSGGQKQRAAIARTLAMDPEIILFDEPTSALDPAMVGEVLSVIRSLADKGLTMIIVTHEMKFARDVSTRVFYMDEGVVYEDGTPEKIFDDPDREKTRKFVRRLKNFEAKITSRDFDFIGINTALEEFGKNNAMPEKLVKNAQVVFEELCLQNIAPRLTDFRMEFGLEYSAVSGTATVNLLYAGDALEPLKDADEIQKALLADAASEITPADGDDGYPNAIKIVLKGN